MSDQQKPILNTNGEPMDMADAVEKASFFAKGAQNAGLPVDTLWPMMAEIGLEPQDGRRKGPLLVKAGIRKIEVGNEERYVYQDFAPPKKPRQSRKDKKGSATSVDRPSAPAEPVVAAAASDELILLLGGLVQRLDQLPATFEQLVAQKQQPSPTSVPENSEEALKLLTIITERLNGLTAAIQSVIEQQKEPTAISEDLQWVKEQLSAQPSQTSAAKLSEEEVDTFNLRGGSVNFEAPGRMSGQLENVARIVVYFMPEDQSE